MSPGYSSVCVTSEENAGKDGEGLPVRPHSGGWPRRILDRSPAAEWRDRKPRRDPASIATSRRRRRAKTEGSTARRWFARYWRPSGASRGCAQWSRHDSREEDRRRLLPRAQGADRRAGPARQTIAPARAAFWAPNPSPLPLEVHFSRFTLNVSVFDHAAPEFVLLLDICLSVSRIYWRR